MKYFHVKTWLLLSLLPGIFAAFVAVPVLLVVLDAPGPLAVLGGVLVSLAVGFGIEMSNASKAKKEEAVRMLNVKRDFYTLCRSNRISSEDDLKSPEKMQLLQQIAQKNKIQYSDPSELVQFFREAKEQHDNEQHQASIAWQKKHEKEKELQKQRRAAKLAEEQQQFTTLTKFAKDHGYEKTLHMLDAELSALESRIQETMTTPPPMLQKQKESDGMFAAGTAYGIGGVVPAAASLAHTAQKNAEIRRANAQIDQLNSALVGAVAMANANRMKNARRIKSFRDTFFSKCGYMKIDESSESIFSHLKFSHTEAIVSETGTVTVKTKVTTDGKVTAFGKSAYADGTVIAGIYSAGVKIGEATLVFPILGTGNLNYRQRVFDWDGKDESVELTGICLTCGAVPTLSYTVRFAPCDLWAINRSFL